MGWGDSYLSFEEFKARTRSQTTLNDAAISAVLSAASRQIDGYCGREFNKSDEDEDRVFSAESWWGQWVCRVIEVGDIVSVTEVASDDGSGTYANVWDEGSYMLAPRSADVKGKPFHELREPLTPSASWPLNRYGIRVTGIFGWPEVPAPVKEVCFLITNRLKSLWDAPFGASGGTSPEMGGLDMTMSITPLMKQMLNPYVVRVV